MADEGLELWLFAFRLCSLNYLEIIKDKKLNYRYVSTFHALSYVKKYIEKVEENMLKCFKKPFKPFNEGIMSGYFLSIF